MSLIKELNRRNVFRVGVAYVIVAWLLLQVADVILPTFRTPDWVMQAFTFLLILGFPLALIFAWAFELTPEGIKLEKHVVRDESITHVTGRKLDFVIIAMLVVALGYFGYDKFLLDPGRDAAEIEAAVQVAEQRAANANERRDSSQTIAVLPFLNMSDDPAQEYFSDGISEEILNLLAKIPELRVTSRSSAFSFKGQNLDIPTMAARLKVAHVLEGSVRKSGNQLRITAQLVEVESDTHLWSETYDRELENIFALQDEISAAIVATLKEHLGLQVEFAPRVIAAANTEAHDAYLRGRYLVVQRNPDTVEGAVREFEKAISHDPEYALAHAELAIAYLLLRRGGYGFLTEAEGLAKAAPHAERALDLDPTLAESQAAAGFISWTHGNLDEALTHYKQAIQINPNYSIVYNMVGGILGEYLGRYAEAFAAYEMALRVDPLSIPTTENYILALIERNQLAEADRELQKLASIAPGHYLQNCSLLQP